MKIFLYYIVHGLSLFSKVRYTCALQKGTCRANDSTLTQWIQLFLSLFGSYKNKSKEVKLPELGHYDCHSGLEYIPDLSLI